MPSITRHWHGQMRMSPEDRAAFVDARIAAVHAGLKLTPDQEKLWPPVETAVRDFAKLRIDRANARMNAPARRHAPKPDDPVTRLRERADNMATSAAAMKKIADAADPLYKTLDDGQKRRLAVLTRMDGRFGGGWRRTMDRMMDRGIDRDGGPAPAASTATATTATAGRTRAAASGSDRAGAMLRTTTRSRWNPAAFRRSAGLVKGRENLGPFAGQWGVALLNDPSREGFSGPVPGA